MATNIQLRPMRTFNGGKMFALVKDFIVQIPGTAAARVESATDDKVLVSLEPEHANRIGYFEAMLDEDMARNTVLTGGRVFAGRSVVSVDGVHRIKYDQKTAIFEVVNGRLTKVTNVTADTFAPGTTIGGKIKATLVWVNSDNQEYGVTFRWEQIVITGRGEPAPAAEDDFLKSFELVDAPARKRKASDSDSQHSAHSNLKRAKK